MRGGGAICGVILEHLKQEASGWNQSFTWLLKAPWLQRGSGIDPPIYRFNYCRPNSHLVLAVAGRGGGGGVSVTPLFDFPLTSLCSYTKGLFCTSAGFDAVAQLALSGPLTQARPCSSLAVEHRAPLQGFLQQAAILLVFQLPWHSASFLWRDGIDGVGCAVQLIWTNGFTDLWTFKTIPACPHAACAAGQLTGTFMPRGDAGVLECERFSRSRSLRYVSLS